MRPASSKFAEFISFQVGPRAQELRRWARGYGATVVVRPVSGASSGRGARSGRHVGEPLGHVARRGMVGATGERTAQHRLRASSRRGPQPRERKHAVRRVVDP